jgi:hypothetical protein
MQASALLSRADELVEQDIDFRSWHKAAIRPNRNHLNPAASSIIDCRTHSDLSSGRLNAVCQLLSRVPGFYRCTLSPSILACHRQLGRLVTIEDERCDRMGRRRALRILIIYISKR